MIPCRYRDKDADEEHADGVCLYGFKRTFSITYPDIQLPGVRLKLLQSLPLDACDNSFTKSRTLRGLNPKTHNHGFLRGFGCGRHDWK